MKRLFALALAAVVAIEGYAVPCVGKTIVVGHYGTAESEMIANVVAVLLRERTGTTVKLRKYGDTREIHKAMVDDEIAIYQEYSRVALTEVLGEGPGKSAAEEFSRVKVLYNDKFDMVWLNPLGFNRGNSQAALIILKHTIAKFPALPKLLNKLSGPLTGAALDGMVKRAASDGFEKSAREFLKAEKLI